MPDTTSRKFLHRGRLTQIPIYLGKQLRGLIYQNDWKVLPMTAVIAAVISIVIKGGFFVTSEGTLRGSFALTCVAIWNGCFNSIQVICRERSVIKRDHRSGMHITSYVVSHMLYQALLCLAQTVITMFVCMRCGVRFPSKGMIFNSFVIEFGMTVFLISYASDMISLFVSALVRTTTAAMTVMPFILIFQLVFSGGFFELPAWGVKVADYTTSHFGLCCMNAQADINSLGSVMGWNALAAMRGEIVTGKVTVGQIADLLLNGNNGALRGLREQEVTEEDVVRTVSSLIGENEFKDALITSVNVEDITETGMKATWGDFMDIILDSDLLEQNRNTEIPFSFSVKQIMDLFGEENIRDSLMTRVALAGRKDAYEHTPGNVQRYWNRLLLTAAAFALLSVLALEFIDKDKR